MADPVSIQRELRTQTPLHLQSSGAMAFDLTQTYPEELWRLYESPQASDRCAAVLLHTYHGKWPYGHARLLAERPQGQVGRP